MAIAFSEIRYLSTIYRQTENQTRKAEKRHRQTPAPLNEKTVEIMIQDRKDRKVLNGICSK